jgi:hypothetical protein
VANLSRARRAPEVVDPTALGASRARDRAAAHRACCCRSPAARRPADRRLGRGSAVALDRPACAAALEISIDVRGVAPTPLVSVLTGVLSPAPALQASRTFSPGTEDGPPLESVRQARRRPQRADRPRWRVAGALTRRLRIRLCAAAVGRAPGDADRWLTLRIALPASSTTSAGEAFFVA